ncbi:MAG: hypothetical protein JST00_11985 [Deltaproteobacteria bacterium]|nr:hypothetical protein [Deltaproteobacteria bacterium]
MSVKSFGLVADARARREGSSQETLVLDVAWELTGRELAVRFPGGRQASKLLEALAGRVPFGEQLVVASDDQAIVFRPAAAFRIGWNANVLFINGPLDHPHVAGILANVHPEQENAMRVTITLSEA